MWHSNRSWSLQTIDSRERLAFKLAHLTRTSCQAFQLDDYIFANDSTGPDGAQAPTQNRLFNMSLRNCEMALAHCER